MNSKNIRKVALIYLNELKKGYYKNAKNIQDIIELDRYTENRFGSQYQIIQRMQIYYNECFDIFKVGVKLNDDTSISKKNKCLGKRGRYPRVRRRIQK